MINAIFIKIIRGYQVAFSPLLGNNCRYYPTCSHYGIEAFQSLPWWKALIKTFWRILRCNPYSKGGYDPVVPSREEIKN